jgi:hypothetical protein
LEIVRKVDGWYYHYHILVDLPFVNQTLLSRLWFETSGSKIVYIQILRDDKGRAIGKFWNRLPKKERLKHSLNYITKYLAKPLSNISLDEYARIVYGSHFVESSFNFTCSTGQNSTTGTGLICSECGLPFQFSRLVIINSGPDPPKIEKKLSDFCERGRSDLLEILERGR